MPSAGVDASLLTTFHKSMQDLFTTAATGVPLAERLRPRTLDDVVGQLHLLGLGKPLRVAFESGRRIR